MRRSAFAFVSLALLLVPIAAEAQRVPVPRTGRRPGEPVPIGRQPEPIARAQALQRSRVSAETYPLLSHLDAPGLASTGQPTSWSTAGAGVRVEYRLSTHASATLDMTSSLDASPMRVQTAELGTRFRPAPWERRWTPYLDARVGYVSTVNAGGAGIPVGVATPTSLFTGATSRGYGAVAGTGIEYALTASWFATTGASIMESRLSTNEFSGPGGVLHFGMTSYRLTLGLKYNPARSMVLKDVR